MQKFTSITGPAAVLRQDNVDTDAIMPMDWCQKLHVNYGDGLFARFRFHPDGTENQDFVLNRDPFRNSRIFIGGDNFGCGSSREHAAWGLAGFGIRVVLASSFGDIFAGNCVRNSVLPVTLAPHMLDEIAGHAERGVPVTVDLQGCTISLPDGTQWIFKIDHLRREMLLEGVDEIGFALKHLPEIESLEARNRAISDWRDSELTKPVNP